MGEFTLGRVRGDNGSPFTPDAVGLLPDRDTYDSMAIGFSFLDSSTGLVYFREGEGWSEGIPLISGASTPSDETFIIL